MKTIKEIDYKTAINFLLPKHYSNRKPQVSFAYGRYINGELVAVCTFGKPASPSLCKGILGNEYSSCVYELNRLCRIDNIDFPLSSFVSECLRELRKYDLCIVSYADTAMGHHGYIYQACNFIYTGQTKARTDKYTEGNKHSRHYTDEISNKRKVRSSKHRYVFFCTSKRKLKKIWEKKMKYKKHDYPKGLNSNYILGHFLENKIIYTEEKI